MSSQEETRFDPFALEQGGSFGQTVCRSLVRFLRERRLETLRRWARLAGGIVYVVARSPRRTALRNLRVAFGDSLARHERRRIAKASFVNLALTAVEACYAPRFERPMSNHIEVSGTEHLLEAHRKGKGILFLIPHMGNWEVSARYLTERIPVVHAITRRQRPEWLGNLVQEIRAGNGVVEIDNRNALRPALSALRRGEMVIMMIDQYMRNGSVDVHFFGHEVKITASAALLAARTGATVLTGACFRLADGKLGGTISPPIETTVTDDRDRDLVVNTERYMRVLEDFIRRRPEEWMWMYRMWRNHEKPSAARVS